MTSAGQAGRDTSVRRFLLPLAPFLADDSVTEIAVNRPGQVYTETAAGWQPWEVPELTCDHLLSLGVAAARYAGENVTFGSTSPILSAVLPDGERSQFVMPPACTGGTVSLTVRKPSKRAIGLGDFLREGFFDRAAGPGTEDEAALELRGLYGRLHDGPGAAARRMIFLERCVELGRNIVISGSTGSGKTTFMKALMQAIPSGERVITIEDVPELKYGLQGIDNQVNLFYPSEASENSTVTAAALLRSCLRMKPDRILLAELRGGEAFDFLNACLSGHGGSITSCHSGSCRGTREYLALKVMQSETGRALPFEAIRKLLDLAVDVIVHIHSDRHRGRCIDGLWFRDGCEPKP